MDKITGFSNSKCQLGALKDLDTLREPIQAPWIAPDKIQRFERLRLATFLPEPYSIPQYPNASPANQKIFAQWFMEEPLTRIALRANKIAFNEVLRGKAVPYFAGYFDALPKPEQKPIEKIEPKAQFVSISERLAKRNSKKSQSKKASKETMKLFKKQNKSNISWAEYNAHIEKVCKPKLSKVAEIKKMAVNTFKKVLSKAAMFII